jgi:ribonuclease E
VEKRGESKAQGERNGQRKQVRPTREERVRAETKLPGVEEYAATEELPQQEEASRRRRRGGRQRERGERTDRALRENKQLAAKHSHPQHTAEHGVRDESAIEAGVPQPLPELPQESPALVLNGAEQTAEVKSSLSPVASQDFPASGQAIADTPQTEHEAAVSSGLLETQPEAAKTGQPSTASSAEQTADLRRSEAAGPGIEPEAPQPEQGVEESTPAADREVRQDREGPQPRPAQIIELPDLVGSGLVMVETIPEKIKSGEAQAGTEVSPRRRKRPLPTHVPLQDEPMVQIETHKVNADGAPRSVA